MCEVGSVKVITGEELTKLYSAARKYYMRLKRKNTKTGIESTYVEMINKLGLSRDDADAIYFRYLTKKYPHLIDLFKKYN